MTTPETLTSSAPAGSPTASHQARLASLPELERTVLSLRQLAGLEHGQVAAMLGLGIEEIRFAERSALRLVEQAAHASAVA